MRSRLFIFGRDTRYLEWLRMHLGILCPEAAVEAHATTALLEKTLRPAWQEFDLLLIVSHFGTVPEDPAAEGLSLLRNLRSEAGCPSIVAIAEEGNELTAVRAIQLGAVDYVPKKLLTAERLKNTIHLALRQIERRMAQGTTQIGPVTLPPEDIAEPGTTQTAAVRSMTMQFIPGYNIGEAIGESEKAVVHRAMSVTLGKEVALKISKSERSEGQLLAREYAAASSLKHPAIVQIYDYGTYAGREFLAMEYFPRGDLKARLREGVDEAESLQYLQRIAAALKVVHEAGLLHRDLKPPNVMVRENDDVALIDFGLARNLEGGLHSTRTGVLRGSPYYMSPEQALGETLDTRSDIYSLGIIFYEMLTGQKPFTGSSAIEVLQEHVNAPIPQLPAFLNQHQSLLTRLLAKSPLERFSGTNELLDFLHNYVVQSGAQSSAA
jgi:eukaryotic-like serine/threonine-protein kinase